MTGESAGHSSEKSIMELILGILGDAKRLLLQEVRLANHEVRQEIRKTVITLLTVATGIALALSGALLIILMLVHLLEALTDLPLWACYGIIAGIFVAIAAMLIVFGINRFRRIRIIPARTIETVKENIRWFKEIATSSRM